MGISRIFIKIAPDLYFVSTKIIDNMKKITKIILISAALILAVGAVVAFSAYKKIYAKNVFLKDKKYLYISASSSYEQVLDSLCQNFDVKDRQMLELVAKLKGYPGKVKPGRYKLSDGMSNNELVNMLRAGNQEPVNVTFNNIRTIRQLCSRISKQLDIDSSYLFDLLQNDEYLQQYGFNKATVSALFIPDTYQFYWNTSAEKFVDKMHGYYKSFWNSERLDKAKQIGMTPLQVSILASIVQMEQAQHREEQPIIAGLYINRLKIGMPLQSCPTLIFAIGDFSIRRVTSKMLDYESPYNTYKYTGMPPSPICFPEEGALKAVLNYEKSNYLYMCAKADFSGYHHFSSDYSDQQRYAREFQKQLDKQGIRNE